jgi:hypothetical protein
MGVLESIENHSDDALALDDGALIREQKDIVESRARFRRARAAYPPALVAMLDVAREYRESQQALINAYRKADLPFSEMTLGRAWLGSHEVDGIDFRALAFRAQEARVTPDGMLRP